ncbi:MrcB family domain-containing protein [Teichococcus aestuarii]|uniref:Type IV methyl-directed restriction enzyme EcoKMcrB subunit DNA-binding domain-containing protein n=1 Tax=Teichococcus aestuarii TaxID=568898 RepID=A0A2U1UYA1_9PROT|nr:DUF3578 domain-containing protein [Pseudoroseomonas aestuarii]PWC26635.1 hypothetical protein CR165_22085 [Pseudoroseomonas aestuarii]
MIQIARRDVELLAQSRTKARYKDLSPDQHQAYRTIHTALEQLGQVAVTTLGSPQDFAAKVTSGFSVQGGVRGYLPKDLWFGAYNRRNLAAFVGMPQVFAIVSGQGVEVGFAATIHPKDFYNKTTKLKIRKAAPQIFAALPPPGSAQAETLTQALARSNRSWLFRRKTRLGPGVADFTDLDAWLSFLGSAEGANWARGSISRYIGLEELDQTNFEVVVQEVATLFAPWMHLVVPLADQASDLLSRESTEELDLSMPLLTTEEVVRPALEEFLSRFSAIRGSIPFGRHAELWPLMERLQTGLAALPPLQAHPQVKVSWSLGAGVWATVPWMALMDERETSSTQRGLYAVFLFPQDMSGVYLTLNQGVTEVVQQHRRSAGRQELAARARRARAMVPSLAEADFRLDDSIDLQTTSLAGHRLRAQYHCPQILPRGRRAFRP